MLRLRHIMLAVAAAAVLCATWRFEDECTPLAPLLTLLFLCGVLGICTARSEGRAWPIGFLLGFLLGPIGVILAGSKRVPQGWPGESRSPR